MLPSLSNTLVMASVASRVLCSPEDLHKYIPPSRSDSKLNPSLNVSTEYHVQAVSLTEDRAGRSPCPGLNALANQGYIPRDGRNIDPTQLKNAMLKVMNLEIEAFDSEIAATLDHSTTGNNSTFNLVDSDVHNSIEVDGSLSRKDLYFGDNIHFNQWIWNQTASQFEGDVITIPIAARSRAYRVAQDAQMVSDEDGSAFITLKVWLIMDHEKNPNFTGDANQQFISGLAPAIYMVLLGGPNATHTRRDWVESFFSGSFLQHAILSSEAGFC